MKHAHYCIMVQSGAWIITRSVADSVDSWMVSHGGIDSTEDKSAPVTEVAIPPKANTVVAESMVRRVAEALRRQGYAGEGITLALPSTWCLAAPVNAANLPRRNRQHTLTYRFEEHLPVPVEEVIADFVGVGDVVLGVAVLLERLAPLVDALEKNDVNVDLISPISMLAIQNLLQQGSTPKSDVVLCWSDQRIELICLNNQRPSQWWSLPADDPQAALLRLNTLILIRTQPIQLTLILGSDMEVCSHANALKEILTNNVDIRSLTHDTGHDGAWLHLAALGAAAISRMRLPTWIDLRRGSLAPVDAHRPLRAPLLVTSISLVLLLASLSVAWQLRAVQYQQKADEIYSQQQAVFRQVYPGQAVPISVKSRLQAEERQLRGLSGSSAVLPPQPSALLTFAELLRRLPSQLRYRVLEIRIDPQRVYLEGQARAHGDADRIAASLRRSHGFDVESPRTERLAGQGVGFTLSAKTTPLTSADSGSSTP